MKWVIHLLKHHPLLQHDVFNLTDVTLRGMNILQSLDFAQKRTSSPMTSENNNGNECNVTHTHTPFLSSGRHGALHIAKNVKPISEPRWCVEFRHRDMATFKFSTSRNFFDFLFREQRNQFFQDQLKKLVLCKLRIQFG